MTETNLYRCFDSDDRLLYVGISLSAINRLKQHERTSEWFAKLGKMTIETFKTRKEALSAERKAIVTERPQYNVHHNKETHAPDNIIVSKKNKHPWFVLQMETGKMDGFYLTGEWNEKDMAYVLHLWNETYPQFTHAICFLHMRTEDFVGIPDEMFLPLPGAWEQDVCAND